MKPLDQQLADMSVYAKQAGSPRRVSQLISR